MYYKDLRVYDQSFNLAIEIHRYSLTLENRFQYDIGSQIRRASRSIPSNIAEGYGQFRTKQETLRFIQVAIGSKDEMLFNLDFLKQVSLLNKESWEYFRHAYISLGKQLYSLVRSLRIN